ncbi:MAG: helix-turn-helix transcriptional regulator [Salinivirgaceae bacterium]|jgi:hypothetical protein
MRFKEKYNISEEFDDIFTFSNEEEELEHDAQMLTFKFLEELEKYHSGVKLKKKELAAVLDKSPSFISQLYAGDKLMNFPLLAKIQKAFDITFDVKVKANSINYASNGVNNTLQNFSNQPAGFWVWMNKKADYSNPELCCDSFSDQITEETAA